VDFQRGPTKNPLSWGELIVKFRNCAQAILDEDVIDKVITKLCNLEEEKDVNNITNLVL
jgi:2-methylcitrate dehydratase PrpD